MKKIFLLATIICLAIGLKSQSTWYPVEVPTESNLRCIDFVNNEIGYIGGFETLLKTTNGGMTWAPVEVDSISTINQQAWDIYDIRFFSELHGRIVLGPWGGMAETFDGGINWTPMVPASSGFCQFGSFYYFDSNHGLAGGAGCFESTIIDRYSDGVWSTTSIPMTWDTSDLVNSLDFLTNEIGLACTARGRVLRTIDGGVTWDSIPNPAFDVNITDIKFINESTAYATYERIGGFGIMKSLDSGLTWEDDIELATFYYPSMFAIHKSGNGKRYFAGRDGNDQTHGVVFDDEGEFWNFNPLELPIKGIDSHSDSITFLVGDSGAVYVNIPPAVINSLEANNPMFYTVFPNPAHEQLTVQASSLGDRISSAVIYGIDGKRIEVVTEIGFDYRKLDISSLQSGTYFIEIEGSTRNSIIEFIKE